MDVTVSVAILHEMNRWSSWENVVNKIYFIYMPSPLLGRTPGFGANRGLFSFFREDKYIAAVQKVINKRSLDWCIERDDTESDIKALIKKDARVLVCAPGLRFMFYRKGFNKNRIVYLSMVQYLNNDIKPVMTKLRELDDERKSQIGTPRNY